jgi:predicted O-methyltransferase YrrM
MSTFTDAFDANVTHFKALVDIMFERAHEWAGCGTYLIAPPNMREYNPTMKAKQELLFETAKKATTAFEIGVHGAHSIFIMLLANPNMNITCVDICHWTHVEKCVKYLNEHFGNKITLIKGDSMHVLSGIEGTFDLIHVDGDHSYAAGKNDLEHAYRLSTKDTAFIFDDYDSPATQPLKDDPRFVIHTVPECSWTNCLARRADNQ